MRGQEYLFGIVPKEEWDKCFMWAFGDDVAGLQTNESPERWNERHGELFKIWCIDDVEECTKEIGKAYIEHLKE